MTLRSTAFTALLSLMEKKWCTAAAAAAVSAVEKAPQAQAQPPSKPGELFWTDGKARSMPVVFRVAAMLTLLAFVAWIFIIGGEEIV